MRWPRRYIRCSGFSMNRVPPTSIAAPWASASRIASPSTGRESDFELELTVNHGRTAQYALGDGYGHLAVVVDDLDAEHARLSKEGLQPKPIKEFFREGTLMARFFLVEDPDGYKIEVMQKHGR